MIRVKGYGVERIDHPGDPIQYATEGRWVFNRAESVAIYTYLTAVEIWLERLWWPTVRRAMHLTGRHHNIACRGRRGCWPTRHTR